MLPKKWVVYVGNNGYLYMMKEEVLVFNFSGAYEAQGFLPWLRKKAAGTKELNLSGLEGTCCYCDRNAKAEILRSLPEELPVLRWLDSGDYHYLSYLLALWEKEPFHLVLLDNHPDNQNPAFDGMLSCGGWVKTLQREQPMLKGVLTIGPEGCPQTLEDAWIEERRGERVYVSLDKDVMDRAWARTDWSQGSNTLEEVKDWLGKLLDGRMEIAAVDICGEMAPLKGATPEDLRINRETNIELYRFITTYLE
jgi:hypothetical protein